MANFDKSYFKSINDYFESIGYPVQFFDNNNEKRFTLDESIAKNSSYYEYTDNPNLVSFYASPIIVEGNELGDKYKIYYNTSTWNGLGAIKELKIQDNQFVNVNSRYLVIEKQKSGGKYLEGSKTIISIEDLATKSEFANFDKFEDLDAPDYSVIFAENPQVSEASKRVDVETLTESQFKKAQEKLEKCKEELKQSLTARENGTIESAMWTFDEVDELYNTKLTTEDKRAYFIYLQNKNQKALSGGFSEKYGSSYPAQATDILELMKRGALFFDPTAKFGERLQPKVIYRSGSVWAKWSSLSSQKDYYVSRFGEEIYNIHLETLRPTWESVWDNRLRVGGEDKSMRAVLLPTSDFARNIKIEQVVNPKDRSEIEENFKIYTSWKKGERVEDITGGGDGSARNNYINKQSLSLMDGFLRWCSMAGSGKQAQEVGIQWTSLTRSVEDVKDRYIKPIRNPFKNERGGEDKWARAMDDARKVGIRLFAQFLAEGLVPKDQTRIEVLWNTSFNSYTEPKLDEVPIGFTYKKYIDNRGLFLLKQSNLNALRYYMSRGSIGLAYGVGLGKTFCSIFVMKQALDLGLCTRPLVIVPNQVYFQFGQEIVRGLGYEFSPENPNSRLNMFYNASGIYNSMGNNAVDGINICTYEATKSFAFHKDYIEDSSWISEAMNVLEMGSENGVMPPKMYDTLLSTKYGKGLFNIESTIDTSEDLNLEPIENDDDNNDDDLDLGDFAGGGDIKDSNVNPKENEILYLNIPSTNYDLVCVDEAHNFNNLFTSVQSAQKEVQNEDAKKIARENNPYSKIRETSGGKDASSRAEKLWWLTKYIQHKNPMGNTILLSATPFTNSPLQLFTMLAYLNYDMLLESHIAITKDFFDLFAKIEYAEDFKTDLTIVKRNKLIGWVNVIAMQKFVYRVFDKSSREEEDKAVIRPNKIVLPLKRMLIDNKVFEFAKENFVSTTIQLSQKQKDLWTLVRNYGGGKDKPDGNPYKYIDVCNDSTQNKTKFGGYSSGATKKKKGDTKTEESENTEIDITDADTITDGTKEGDASKDKAKALQCLMWGRQICLNPYLFKCSGYKTEPTAQDYVEASPKLLYVMECIRSVKAYHDTHPNSPLMSGQVIYMNFGVKAFTLIRDYLVSQLGFDINEIGIISGSANFIGKKSYDNKQKVADAFLGRVLDTETGKYTQLEDTKRVKILIGSESIKEGINLQDYASVLYNCFLDFNPTDAVQVEGRIWRQGNAFANVRIVTPLMSDCIDVFMFQKLEDKTERINQIWTRNGNLNELDTTAFNPAELKYELLSDPVAIAQLEKEYKKEQLDVKIAEEGEIFSRYIGWDSIYAKGEQLLTPIVRGNTLLDFRTNMYYKISQIRPDLITKPLWSEEQYDSMLKLILNTQQDVLSDNYKNKTLSELKETFPHPLAYAYNSNYMFNWRASESPFNWENASSNDLNKNVVYRDWVNKVFNYTADELVQLMVQVFKDQKIAFPRGYSSNWRELLPKKQMPIIEGDEVEFDTKKGRKKGIAEFVADSDGDIIVDTFFTYAFDNHYFDNNDVKIGVKELKLKTINKIQEDFDNKNVLKFSDLSKEEQKEVLTWLKWLYKNDTTDTIIDDADGTYSPSYVPVSLDVDEVVEDWNIVDKNIVKVAKKEDTEEKVVKPTKYPDPFVYSNKDTFDNLKEIAEYLKVVAHPKSEKLRLSFDGRIESTDGNSNKALMGILSLPVDEQAPLFDRYFGDIIHILANDYNSFSNSKSEIIYLADNKMPKTWVDVESKANQDSYGLFQNNGNRFYGFDIPRTIAEFRVTTEKQFVPNGINSLQDITNLIEEQKTKINGFELEKTQLDDSQVFDELVQEVIRRQAELNSEEIRAGSSYMARAELFGRANADYIGNDMLSIFQNTDEETLATIDFKFRPSERAIADARERRIASSLTSEATTEKKPSKRKAKVTAPIEEVEVVEVVAVDEKMATENVIEILRGAMEYQDDEEQSQTQEIIDILVDALNYM